MKLYELYWCDDWRSTKSINIGSRIIVTDNLEDMQEAIYKVMKENENEFKEFDLSDKYDLLDGVIDQMIPNLHYNEVEINEFND